MKIVAPPENWKQALDLESELGRELTADEAKILILIQDHLGKRLGLETNTDLPAGKFYYGLPDRTPEVPQTPAKGAVVYPLTTLTRSPLNNDPTYAPARPDKASPLVERKFAKISNHFNLLEFAPNQDSSYKGVRCHPGLVKLLEEIRSRSGAPIKITSGYRPPRYNREAGGVVNSYHLDGLAADIYSEALTTSQLHAVCDRIVGDRGGVGYYPSQGFVHVDVRGYRARWEG